MKLLEKIFKSRKNKPLKIIATALAAMIVFATVYSLILPAITIEEDKATPDTGIVLAGQNADETPSVSEDQTNAETDSVKLVTADVGTADEDAQTGELENADNNTAMSSDMKDKASTNGDSVAEPEEMAATPAAENADLDQQEKAENEGTEVANISDVEPESPIADNSSTGLVSMPAVTFEEETNKDNKLDGVANIKVTVEAEEGTFPEGTTLKIKEVTSDRAVAAAAKEAVAGAGESLGEVKALQAVDITFFNKEGERIEPLKDIKVTIQSDMIREVEDPVLIHVPDNGQAEIIDQMSDERLEVLDIELAEDEVAFEAGEFSVYVIVGTETLTGGIVTADGNTYEVTITYEADAKIPEGASLEIKEFEQDSEEYQKAYEKVIEYKKNSVDGFSEEGIGFDALDITIFDENGEEVEPSAPVQVTIVRRELPEDIEEDKLSETFEVQHIVGNDDESEVVIVARNGDGESRIDVDEEKIVADFTVESFSTYTLTWGGVQRTIHYGYIEGGTFHEFENGEEGTVTLGLPTRIGDQLDLEKEISGYRYVTTRINNPTTGRQISALLQTDPPYNNGARNNYTNANLNANPSYNLSMSPTSFNARWRYRQLSSLSWNPTGDSWQTGNDDTYISGAVTGYGVTKPVTFANSETDIYVVYEAGSNSSGGGDSDGDIDDLSAPATEKKVDSNGDGTYDISLSVTGESRSQSEKTKANVIVVLDTSWSMYQRISSGSSTSRLMVAKTAINSLADKLFALNTSESPDTVELAFVTFAQRVRNEIEMQTIYSGTSSSSFKSMINGLDCASGTNWDDALYAANHIDFGDSDPTYVVFITDGGTISMGHPVNGAYSDWDGGTYTGAGEGATNYVAAASAQANAILSAGKKLYKIGAFGTISTLENGIPGTYLGRADNLTVINSYFDNIISEIQNVLGYEDVTINDGITAMTATTLVNGAVDQFRYTITQKDGSSTTYKSDAELKAAYPGIGTATYNTTTKSVQWNLGDNYQLKDGVTYTVAFTVWPSQASYDLIANLNNGIQDYDSLDPTVKAQIIVEDGKYYLKTNTSATVDYTAVKTKDGSVVDTKTVEGAQIKDPNGKMILDGTGLKIKKKWNDTLDHSQLLELLTDYLNEDKTDTTYTVTLRLWQDEDTSAKKEIHTAAYQNGFVYKPTVTIENGEVTEATWPEIDVSISPGVMVKSTEEKEKLYKDTTKYPRVTYGEDIYIILESGHDFDITEDNTDLHFELNTETYHPMMVDGVLKTVTFSADGKSITDMSPDTTALSSLEATNDLKGGIEINKIVTTKDDASDTVTTDETMFTFTVKLQKSATDTTPVYTTADQYKEDGSTRSGSLGFRIFASTVIPEGATNIVEDTSYEYQGLTYKANKDDSGTVTGYTARGTIGSTGELTLKMRQSDTIRIVNVPAGSYYTVTEETPPSGYEYLKSEGTPGTVPANTQADAKIWNKRTAFTVDLLKVDELHNETTLAGAVFKLYKEDGTTPASDADGKAIGTLTTGADGKVVIGKLLPGSYKLVETEAPDGYYKMSEVVAINVLADTITYQQGSREPATAAKSTDGLTWTITVTNSTGVELPNTGGPGTLLYTLSGLALIVMAASMYGFRMRRR